LQLWSLYIQHDELLFGSLSTRAGLHTSYHHNDLEVITPRDVSLAIPRSSFIASLLLQQR
jgi:hypothetical protein